MTEITIDTDSGSIFARLFLNSGLKGRPLVVALHGGGFTSRYFDRPGHSIVDTAVEYGCGVVLLDRPGNGRSTFKKRAGDIFNDNADALVDAINSIWRDVSSDFSGIYLVGHSIGGAMALMIAARQNEFPLLAVSVSGIGDVQGDAVKPIFENVGQNGAHNFTREMMSQLFFAPGESTDSALDALEFARCDPNIEEIAGVYGIWAPKSHVFLGNISVPVQLILAEHELLWECGDAARTRINESLAQAERTDVFIYPGAGHTIEFHSFGGQFYRRVFDFCG